MEEKCTIYTYGNENIASEELLRLMLPHGINCVVDCRPQTEVPIADNTPSHELQGMLNDHHMAYIPFHQHWGVFPNAATDKRGRAIYKKAIETEQFLTGVERIKNGMKKGFTIVVIDGQSNTKRSKRFTVIGKFLKETCKVVHLCANGHYYTQEELDMRTAEDAQKKEKAYQLGQTGEEIAGLYLMQNGFQILDHNWNLHKGCEVDIVARKDNKLHFIEVKTRSSDRYGTPEQAITPQKMRHILKAIHEYRYRKALTHVEYQIDSIAIVYRSEHDYDLAFFPDIRPPYYTKNYNMPYKNH